DGHRHLRLRVDRLGGGDQPARAGDLVAESGDVVVVLVGQGGVLLLVERAVSRFVRDGKGRRAGDRVPARVTACQQRRRQESKCGSNVALHGGPFHGGYSRPYFFGSLQMIAAARICGTYSMVSSGSFFKR